MSETLSLNFRNSNSSVSETVRVGNLGEELARRFLMKNRYRLVVANFKVPVGRNSVGASVTGEVDIIALDENDVLCFVEVKTRSSDEFASPLAAVDLRKQRQIIRTAKVYRKIFRLNPMKFRYDVVSIVLDNHSRPKIELFTVMRKMKVGYDSKHGDWEYSVIDAEATHVLARGHVESCVSCHDEYAKSDFVTRTYLKKPAAK